MCQHLEGYSNRGLRKRDYPPAMYIQQPWWKEYRLFNDTVSRTGMLLSEGEDDVDVLVIPPDLLDKLSKKGYDKLVREGSVRFSTLQYLMCRPIKAVPLSAEEENLVIELENYVLLSPDNIPLDDKDKTKLQEVMDKDPLALIEYWSIDPDYDGVTFRSQWQDYRENTENDSDPLHCIYTAVLRVPRKPGRTVCVKAVDVFGFESMVVETIG